MAPQDYTLQQDEPINTVIRVRYNGHDYYLPVKVLEGDFSFSVKDGQLVTLATEQDLEVDHAFDFDACLAMLSQEADYEAWFLNANLFNSLLLVSDFLLQHNEAFYESDYLGIATQQVIDVFYDAQVWQGEHDVSIIPGGVAQTQAVVRQLLGSFTAALPQSLE